MKNIILTGGSDGLGKAFATLCIKESINLIVLSRQVPSYKCIHIKTDLSSESDIVSACELIKQKYSSFDAIINCAGTMSLESPDALTYKDVEYVYKVNSIAPIILISNLLPLIKKNAADIMNVTSITATMYDIAPSSLAYSSSKWALRGSSIMLKKELENFPSRIITFNPCGMNTDLVRKYDENLKDLCKDWVDPARVAEIMLYILKLPKNIEVSEITLDRKK